MARRSIRIRRVEKVVPPRAVADAEVRIPDEAWHVVRIKFTVPYNVFRVRMEADNEVILHDIIDDTIDEIDLSRTPLVVRNYIRFIIENITDYAYFFRVGIVALAEVE